LTSIMETLFAELEGFYLSIDDSCYLADSPSKKGTLSKLMS